MRSKWLNKILGVVVVALLFGFISIPAISQAANPVIEPVGKTEEQASQLIFWYDQTTTAFGRRTFIQLTNASPNTAVNVHVQIFTNTAGASCGESDFDDSFTPSDTHIYDLSNIVRNSPATAPPISIADTKGFIVITPINNTSDRKAISFQHLFGDILVVDSFATAAFRLNAMGRDAVNFVDGSIVPDGTVLDGVANGYVVLQPVRLKFNFATIGDIHNFADIVSIAFSDNYSGPFGYTAVPGNATWATTLFDVNENPLSCGNVPQSCFFDIGINDVNHPANTLLGSEELCPGNNTADGWVKLQVGGLTGSENEVGIVGVIGGISNISSTNLFGGATWMYVE